MHVLHKTGSFGKRKRSASVSAATFKRIKGGILKQRAATRRTAFSGKNPARVAGLGPGQKEIKTCDLDLQTPGVFNPIIDDVTTNGSCRLMNAIEQGTADYQRVGKQINMKSLRIRGHCIFQSSAPLAGGAYSNLNNNWVRFVLVYMKDQVAAIPSFDDIFSQTSAGGSTFSNVMSPVDSAKMTDVTVLRDWVIKSDMPSITTQTTGAAGDIQWACRMPFDEYVKLDNLPAIFKGTASPITVDLLTTGALLLYARADTNLPGPPPNMLAFIFENSNARLRYTDH